MFCLFTTHKIVLYCKNRQSLQIIIKKNLLKLFFQFRQINRSFTLVLFKKNNLQYLKLIKYDYKFILVCLTKRRTTKKFEKFKTAYIITCM